jgi:hypothetical protein
MNPQFLRYRELEQQLCLVRWINQGLESESEDALLDQMEDLWWKLDPSERKILDQEPDRSLITDSPPQTPPRKAVDIDTEIGDSRPARTFKDEEAA